MGLLIAEQNLRNNYEKTTINFSLKEVIMKSLIVAVILTTLLSGCSSTWVYQDRMDNQDADPNWNKDEDPMWDGGGDTDPMDW